MSAAAALDAELESGDVAVARPVASGHGDESRDAAQAAIASVNEADAAAAVNIVAAAVIAGATVEDDKPSAAARVPASSSAGSDVASTPGQSSTPQNASDSDGQWSSLRPSASLASPGVLSLKWLTAGAESSGSTDCSSSLPSTEPSTTPSESSSSNSNHKRLKIAPRKARKSKHLQLPHPLGVKPLGNAFLSPGQNCRSGTLGTLSALDDDIIVHILGLLSDSDVSSLVRLEGTSRGLYAFVNSFNSIWRDSFLQRFDGKLKKWCGSWKRTYAWHHKLERLVSDGQQFNSGFDGSDLALLEPPNPPIKAPYLFSDTLFQPFRLSLSPLDHYLADEVTHIPIAHVDVSKPGAVALFRENHAEANVPAIIEGAMAPRDWPCREWTLETLAGRWPNRFFQCEAVRCRLPTYHSYAKSMQLLCDQAQQDDDAESAQASKSTGSESPCHQASRSPSITPSSDGSGEQKQLHQPPALVRTPLLRRASSLARSSTSSFNGGSNISEESDASFDPSAIPDESPFYLFDAAFADDPHASLEWRVPKIFHQISAEVPDLSGHTAGVRSDLFSLLGPLRPDHRWIIAGPGRSGSGWHKDPNGTSAWNAVLTGRKAWMMLPPHVTPPGVYVSEDEAEVTAPLSIAEWLIGFAAETRKSYGPAAPRVEDRVLLEGVCEAGEVLYVPSGWWHLVVNLEESVALTQNFVSPPELGVVLDFMKNKSDQLSGFKKSNAAANGTGGSAVPASGGGDTNSKEDEDEEECEGGAGFGVFELFCDRLGKFDKGLLSTGLEKMRAIEEKREAERRLAGQACSRIVRAKGTTMREGLWDRLRKQDGVAAAAAAAAARSAEGGDVAMGEAAGPAFGSAEQAAPAAELPTFSFGAQLDDEELEEVPW